MYSAARSKPHYFSPCRMRRSILACSGLLVLALPACRRSEPVRAGQLAGCLAFERLDGRATPLGAEMPETVRMDSARKLHPDGRRNGFYPFRLAVVSRRVGAGRDSLRLDATHVVPWPPDWDRYYTMTAWRFAPPDSVTLVFHANMSKSWQYRLRSRGLHRDTLVGRAVMYSDVVSDTEHQVPIMGRRTSCPAVRP